MGGKDLWASAADLCEVEVKKAESSEVAEDTQPETVNGGANPLLVARKAVKSVAPGGSKKEKAKTNTGPGPGRGVGNRAHYHNNLRPVSPEMHAWGEATAWITVPTPKIKDSKKRKLSLGPVPITIWPQYTLQGMSSDTTKYVVARRNEQWLQEIMKVLRPKGLSVERLRRIEKVFMQAIHEMLTRALANAGVEEAERRKESILDGVSDGRLTIGTSQTKSGFKIAKQLHFKVNMLDHELMVLNSARAMIVVLDPAAKRFMQEAIPKLFADCLGERRAGRIALGLQYRSLTMFGFSYDAARKSQIARGRWVAFAFFFSRGSISSFDPRLY